MFSILGWCHKHTNNHNKDKQHTPPQHICSSQWSPILSKQNKPFKCTHKWKSICHQHFQIKKLFNSSLKSKHTNIRYFDKTRCNKTHLDNICCCISGGLTSHKLKSIPKSTDKTHQQGPSSTIPVSQVGF